MAENSFSRYPIIPFLRQLPLTETPLRLLSLLFNGVVLPSAKEISALTGLEKKYIGSVVKSLIDGGYVCRQRLGWSDDLTGRIWLTSKIEQELGTALYFCDKPWFLARRLERLPVVENMYSALPNVRDLGTLQKIQWHEGLALDVSANFEDGWVAAFFTGLLENERDIINRITAILPNLRDHALNPADVMPSFFLWIANGHWQAEQVRRAASLSGVENLFAIYVTTDGTYIPAPEPLVSTEGLYQFLDERDMGGWPWEQRLRDSQWTTPDARVLGKVLDAVIRFPGAWFSLIHAATGIEDEKRVNRALRRMQTDLGWVQKKRFKGRYRYTVTGPGFHPAARRDGVSNVGWNARAYVPAFRGRPRHQDHEDGSMGLFEELIIAGCLVEPAWRCGDDLGQQRGGIVPDGIVYLARGPYGPGWYYLEYERSARYKTRAENKLKGYLSTRRRDSFPVLFVLWNDTAERNFQKIGREHGLRMATTTTERLEIHGAVGNPNCWSHYGEPAIIG